MSNLECRFSVKFQFRIQKYSNIGVDDYNNDILKTILDSDLNKATCEGIISNSLWKPKNLNALKKSSQDLCQILNEFIHSHQDLNDAKIWTTPEERRKSPVPLPTRVLFFDGHVLREKL